MTTIYELTFKETGEQEYFTSLIAIVTFHGKNKLKFSPSYIHSIKFKDNIYENRLIKIRKLHALGKADYKEENNVI